LDLDEGNGRGDEEGMQKRKREMEDMGRVRRIRWEEEERDGRREMEDCREGDGRNGKREMEEMGSRRERSDEMGRGRRKN